MSCSCALVDCNALAAYIPVQATKSGGVMTPVGMDPFEVRLPLLDAATREVDIKGSLSYCNELVAYDY